MRKLLLLLIFTAQFIFVFSQIEKTSVTHLLVEDNKEWNILHLPGACILLGTPGCITEFVFLKGDTLINDISYLKMYHSYYEDKSLVDYMGGMRQEGGKVYAIDTEDKEELLYDFDMEVGDVIRIRDQVAKLKEVREESFGGVIRKVYVFGDIERDYTFDGEWIEGIGSMLGVVYTDMWNTVNQEVQLLSCQHDGELLFQNERYENDFVQRPFTNMLLDDTNWIDLTLSALNPDYRVEAHYEFKGDTLIEGTVYRKLYCGGEFVGGMYEDTDQKMYIRKIISEEDFFIFSELKRDTTYLLYSFSDGDWREGGSFEYLGYNSTETQYIKNLDYMTLLDGNQYLHANGFIHSIGSMAGIFGHLGPYTDNDPIRLLYEYSKGGQVIYKRDLTSIENVKEEAVKVYIDASGQVVVSLNNAIYQSIQLFDIEGILIRSASFKGQNDLIIPDLSKGLYLYRIESEERRESIVGKISVTF